MNRNPHHDLLLNTEVATSLQGHVGQNTKQVFETLTGTPFSQPKLKLAGYEFVLRDQFHNYYHKMRAVLFDGEMYDVDQWIKPSMMMKSGGGHAAMDDFAARRRLKITEAMLMELREVGAVAMARMNLEILKGRHTSTNPIAIETQDITHQANKLEDALVAAKAAAGEPVKEGPQDAPEFVPLKAAKAARGAKLEGTKGAEVIQFPGIVPDLTVMPEAPKTVAHEQVPGS